MAKSRDILMGQSMADQQEVDLLKDAKFERTWAEKTQEPAAKTVQTSIPVLREVGRAAASSVGARAMVHQRTILIVEDDDAIRGCISDGMRMAGHAVIAVPTTTEALQELESNESIDLAIVDVLMPPGRPHGFAFGRMAKLKRPDLRLIFISGDARVVEEDGDPPGPVLIKPVRIGELLRMIGGAELVV